SCSLVASFAQLGGKSYCVIMMFKCVCTLRKHLHALRSYFSQKKQRVASGRSNMERADLMVMMH
ncbi:hypothetical protein, partial [Escherichia coli]|uniref:hypothetical protein n=1 Tax=Escherichia coli TaxID=562 RepID=UPI003EDFC067